MARRTLTSRSRAAARDSSRFATLAQPISSTAATAASMIQSAVRSVGPTSCCGSGTMLSPSPAMSGFASTMRRHVAPAQRVDILITSETRAIPTDLRDAIPDIRVA